MRFRSVYWGLVVLAGLTGASSAQPPASPNSPAEMTVVVPEVEVRSGPTMQHYPTAKLRQGDRVSVVCDNKAQPGWAAIKPPAGSFSWIREKFVRKVDARSGFVQAPSNALVTVMPGSSLVEQALNVESGRVPSGCLVVILDKPFHWEGENWLPIQPTPTEVRYVPLAALRLPPAPVQVAAGFPTAVGSDVVAKADEAFRSGKLELAKQLYRQAADSSPEPQKSYAINRLASLTTTGTAPAAATHSNWQPVASTSQGFPSTPPPSSPPPALAPIPNSNPLAPIPNSIAPLPAAASAPSTVPVTSAVQTISNHTMPATAMTARQAPQWSGWGYLRKAGFPKDGQTVFVLETLQRQPLLYAVEQPGSNQILDKMIGRLVCLYGPITYRSGDDPRIQYMVASWYATPP